MKVTIGKYVNWVGPYQIVDWFSFLPILQRDLDSIGDWLAKTWVTKFCDWYHTKKKRKIKVKIDYWDTWGVDTTVASIVLPLLKRLKEVKHGAGYVYDEDVPENLRRKIKQDDHVTDDLWFKRYDWILEEIIWTFEQLQPEYDWEYQFHSGVCDYNFVKCEGGSEMVKGPNHTAKFDREGFMKHSDRIDNGLRLFSRYYRTFWD